ncbi:MAG: HEAT repeat domain-containing protein [Rhodanobacteraceae bacterium]|nr:HEAT repeat domain-containing protein [Rhodanobacteraceae bacterium]
MLSTFRRLFQVLPDEGGKVLVFALLAGLLQAGVAIGMVAADSLFLAGLGIEMLPLVFIFMPVVMLVYAPLYSLLVAGLGVRALFRLTLTALVIGGLAFGFGGERFGDQTWFLFAAKFYAGLWFIALYTLFWNFADDYFSILDGKRLYGLIAAGSAAGSMIGGGLVSGLTGLVPATKLFLVWSIVAILTFPVFLVALRRYRAIAVDDAPAEEALSLPGLLRFIAATFRRSPFALALALICFAMVALTSGLEYLTLGVFAEGRNANELASLLGGLYALAGALTLIVNLFFFNRIVGRLGVGSTALVVPLTYLGAFVFFYLNAGFGAALFAFYAYQALFVAVEYNNINLLYNAMPSGVKRQLRTFIEAMAEPAASATAGLFLYYSASHIDPDNLALTGLLAACGALAIAAFIRQNYVRALAVNLRSDWLDFANPESAWRAQLTAADFTLLRNTAFSGSRPQQMLAVELLWRLQDSAARAALLNFLSTATPAEADRLRPAISGLIQQGDTEALAETLLWLESDHGPHEPEVLDEFTSSGAFPMRRLQTWRNSEHPAHQAAIAVARWNGSRIEEVALALEEVRVLLHGDHEARRYAIRAIGDSRHPRHASELLPFLRDDDLELRLEALRSLRKLASPDSSAMLPYVLPLVREGSSEERLLILAIAERIGDTAAVQPLLWAAEHFSSAESRQLEAIIAGMGLKAIPGVIHLLRNVSAPFHSRSVAVRALARLAMPQLLLITEELIDDELKRAREAVMAHRALAADRDDGVGQTVLTRFYRDAAAEGLEFVLEVLSLTGRLPDFDLIRASLAFANARDRANAIETIQQSCSRTIFHRICELIEATVPGSGLQAALADTLTLEAVLRRAASSNIALEASAGLIAFRERNLPGGFELLRARLDQSEPGRINEWLIALLPRFVDTEVDFALAAHPVDRVASLVRAEFFSDARILALDYLAAHAVEHAWPAGELVYDESAPTEELFILTEGSVEVKHARGGWTASVGSTFGQRVLMGDTRRKERAVSNGCHALVLQGSVVMRAIEIFPAMGVSLYQFKTIAAIE